MKVIIQAVLVGIFILTLHSSSPAQIPDTLWTKLYGGQDNDRARSLSITSDGGFLMTGTIDPIAPGFTDAYILKTDADGNVEWNKTFAGAWSDASYDGHQTADGGYIVAGETKSFTNDANWDILLYKLDSNGDSVWAKGIVAPGTQNGRSVQEVAGGGYILAGTSFDVSLFDVYLVRTDSNGDTLWTKTYGGPQNDWGWQAIQTSDGGFFISGFTASFGAGGNDVYLLRTDANGDTLWTKTYGGIGSDWSYAAVETSDGGFVVCGTTQSFGAGEGDVYLIKVNGDGDSLWTRTYGGTADERSFSLIQTSDGGFMIVGGTQSFGAGEYDMYVIQTDANGNSLQEMVYTKTIGESGNDWAFGVDETSDGGFAIAGYSNSFGQNDYDIYLIKLGQFTSIGDEDESTTPHEFALAQNYPNPFNPSTTISWQLPVSGLVSLSVYNVTGQKVTVLVNEIQKAGYHSLEFNASSLPSGLYFYRLRAGNLDKMKKMVLMK
jgi:hypothetical protein